METTTKTKQELDAIINLVKLIGDTIEQAGSIPSGHLYAILLEFGCSLQVYDQLIQAFKDTRKIREENNVIYWIAA